MHRDIYHENVLVSDERAVVIDLGAARRTTGPLGPRARGPEPHWPPEYLVAYDEAEPSADLYGLGVLLYRVLTGDLPRTSVSPALIQAPEALRDLTLRCLEANPTRRPSAVEAANLLQSWSERSRSIT